MESDHLFTDSDFAWSIRMRRKPREEFFAPQDESGEVLEQRRQLLNSRPDLYTATTETGKRLLLECWDLAEKWGQLSDPRKTPGFVSLGCQWEADFILMDAESTDLVGACVCFPSSWNLQKSVGVSLFEVHGRVPGLNETIGDKIKTFLERMPPEQAFFRENWGLTRTAELNYHPELKRSPLDSMIDKHSIFLRIEHQAIVKLPSGILLGVRIEPVGFPDLVERSPGTARNLLRKLETMPPEVASYKSLDRGIEGAQVILRDLLG